MKGVGDTTCIFGCQTFAQPHLGYKVGPHIKLIYAPLLNSDSVMNIYIELGSNRRHLCLVKVNNVNKLVIMAISYFKKSTIKYDIFEIKKSQTG